MIPVIRDIIKAVTHIVEEENIRFDYDFQMNRDRDWNV